MSAFFGVYDLLSGWKGGKVAKWRVLLVLLRVLVWLPPPCIKNDIYCIYIENISSRGSKCMYTTGNNGYHFIVAMVMDDTHCSQVPLVDIP